MMTVPFFGVAREFATYRGGLMERIERVLATGQMLQGVAVEALERRVAEFMGRRHAVAVNSCTDALAFSLIAAGIKAGDEVLVTDFSFVATASCIARVGAIPKFVDIDQNYDLDLTHAKELLSARTRGIIVGHLYGLMSDPVFVQSFAREHELLLIEDAAQAYGAMFGDRFAGSLGIASSLSFDPTKPVSAPGSGGMLLTDDSEIAERVRRLRYHGRAAKDSYFDIGYNSQMSSLTAAVLDFKLDYQNEWLTRRREVARRYVDGLRDLPLSLHLEEHGALHIYHKFVVRSDRRDALRAYLQSRGIQVMVHYPEPLHYQPCFAFRKYPDAFYPKTLDACRQVLSLPIHAFLSDHEVDMVLSAIRDFFAAG